MDTKEVVKKVKTANEVSITDLKNCCKWKQCNGGEYSYTLTFIRISDKWIIKHSTSSEFNYCGVFGEFRDCWDCEYFDIETEECRAEPDRVTTQEVIEAVKRAVKDEFKEIDIDGETVKYGEYGCYQCRKKLH